MVCMLEKRINDSAAEQSDIEEKIKNLEGMQISLVHSVEEVQATSSDIERTAAIWLPKYEATSHIVNELSFKVEQMDKKFQGICCHEVDLTQQVARVTESKVSSLSLKEIGSEVKDLYEQVHNVDHNHCEVYLHT